MDQTDGSPSEDGIGQLNHVVDTATSRETRMAPPVSEEGTDQSSNGEPDVHDPEEINQPDILVRANCNRARQVGYDIDTTAPETSHGSLQSQLGSVLVNGSGSIGTELDNEADILDSDHCVINNREDVPVDERVFYIPNNTSGPLDIIVDAGSIMGTVTLRNLSSVDSIATSAECIDQEEQKRSTHAEQFSGNKIGHAIDSVIEDDSTEQAAEPVGSTVHAIEGLVRTELAKAEVGSTEQTSDEVGSTEQARADVGSNEQATTEVDRPEQTAEEVDRHEQTTEEVESEGIVNFRKVVQEFLDGIKDKMPTEEQEEPDTTESLAAFVRENIASKNIRTIKYALRDLTKADRKAVVDYEIDGKTALFVACYKGTEEIVKYFVEECGADTNKKGKYDCGEKDMLVAPLWLATIEERPEVVKILACHGADVNAVCETGSTAVHAACYMNNTELVEALCNSGSDVNIPDTLFSTCLKDSVDNIEICKILIAHGADINYRRENQYSILHHAIKAHNMDTVEVLVRNGAGIMIKDFEGNDCLRYAILVYAADIVEFLMDSINANAPKSADIYDLMGAMAVGRGEYKEGYEYWLRSMYIRTELHGGETSLREVPEIFGKGVDVPQSIADLISLAKDCNAMDTLALAITSHQLGPTHWDTIQRILLQSTSLMHNDDLVQAFDMTRYVYSLLLNKYKILHRMQEFALCQLFEICSKFQIQTLRGVSIPRFKEILEIFRDMIDFLEKAHLLKRTDTEYFIQNSNIFDKVIHHVFDMIYLLKVNNKSSDEKFFFNTQMSRLVDMDLCDINGVSLLHKSLTRNPKVVFHFMESGPREGRHEDLCVTRELIHAGANVNVQDLKRDTPLHSHLKWIEKYNFFTKKIIELFLEYGLHVDLVDIENNSLFVMIKAQGMALCPVKSHTLQCLAVKVIRDHGIHFRALLPIPLQRFVDMHK